MKGYSPRKCGKTIGDSMSHSSDWCVRRTSRTRRVKLGEWLAANGLGLNANPVYESAMRIEIGELEVSESGSVLVPEGATLTLWPFGKQHTDRLWFQFPPAATSSGGHAIEVHNSDDGPTFVLSGWSNSLGTAVTKPIQIGTLDGRPFYILFAVHSIGDGENTVRMFSYSLLKERADARPAE